MGGMAVTIDTAVNGQKRAAHGSQSGYKRYAG